MSLISASPKKYDSTSKAKWKTYNWSGRVRPVANKEQAGREGSAMESLYDC